MLSSTSKEDQNQWQETELAMIAQDHYLLDSFQTLKYINGKHLNSKYLKPEVRFGFIIDFN